MTTPLAKRLLIIKFGAIGDCVMTVPAAYVMHEAGYEIDWVCSQSIAPVLRLYPWINIHTIDDRALLRGRPGERVRAVFGLWRIIMGRRYDICATLYYDSRYNLLTLPARAARKVMLSKLDRATTLLPARHHTDEYARILSGRKDDETQSRIAPLSPPSLPATAVPRIPGKPRIVLVPGGARNMMRDNPLRRWPVESYVTVVQALLARGYEVVLAGGPDDVWVTPLFASFPVVNCIGTLSLVETLSLLDSADVTVTHDTGPLHLAGITRTAIVAIFGPTTPHNFCPQRGNCVALWGGEDFACRPCYDGRDFAPCSNNGCVQQVTPAMALKHVEEFLAAARERRAVPLRIVVPETKPELVSL